MAKKISFRKPQERKQGLKFLFYGENGVGKSVAALTFPQNAVIDSESKIGVYEKNPKYQKNIAGIADTSDYYETIDLAESVVNNPDQFKTFTIDSLTNIANAMQVSAMEVEEKRALKKGKDIDDATVSQRGWGKVKLNTVRLNNYIAQASANGTTVIAIAHKEDIMQEVGDKRIKIGERADLRKGAEHVFDVILKFYKEKDIATGEYKFFVEVEKDTTGTYKVGTVIENFTYDNYKDYIEGQEKSKAIEAKYDKTIDDNMRTMQQEQETHDEVVEEFKELFKKAVAKDKENKEKVAKLMKDLGVEKYTDSTKTAELKKVIKEIKNMIEE